MQRHYHETVHYVISGHGHSEIEDDTEAWAAGDFIYTPPWTWHRHYNDSADEPVEFLTIENSRLLQALGITRRQSAGPVHGRRGARPIPGGRSHEPTCPSTSASGASWPTPTTSCVTSTCMACAPGCCAPDPVPT